MVTMINIASAAGVVSGVLAAVSTGAHSSLVLNLCYLLDPKLEYGD